MTAESAVLLFSYGNLQQKELQVAIFGRELGGRRDFLPGYARAITDVGNVDYYNVEPSSDPESVVWEPYMKLHRKSWLPPTYTKKDASTGGSL